MKAHEEKLTMTVAEFAEEMKIGINTAYQLTNAKEFPVLKVGRKKLIIRAKVEEWLESNIGQDFNLIQ